MGDVVCDDERAPIGKGLAEAGDEGTSEVTGVAKLGNDPLPCIAAVVRHKRQRGEVPEPRDFWAWCSRV